MRRALGLGVDALFGGKSYEDEVLTTESTSEVKMIKTSLIEPRKDQPRKTFDREQLQALANSISEHGVIQPPSKRLQDFPNFLILIFLSDGALPIFIRQF